MSRQIGPGAWLGTAILAGGILPLSGCVIAVGNTAKSDDFQWREDENHPRIGVTLGSVDSALASQLKLDEDDSTLILSVTKGMPADKAGMAASDVVFEVNGSDRASPSDVRRAIRSTPENGELRLRVMRAGEPVDVTLVVDKPAPSNSGY